MTSSPAQRLADELAQAGALPAEWRTAFRAVPRHLFVPDAFWIGDESPLEPVQRADDPQRWLDLTASDIPLITQVDDGATPPGKPGRYPSSSVSQPSLVAMMLDRAQFAAGHTVLEIGTGSGYNAALLCERLGEANVTTVEIDLDVAERARAALTSAGYKPAVVSADGEQGWPARAPYERAVRLLVAGIRDAAQCSVKRVEHVGRTTLPRRHGLLTLCRGVQPPDVAPRVS